MLPGSVIAEARHVQGQLHAGGLYYVNHMAAGGCQQAMYDCQHGCRRLLWLHQVRAQSTSRARRHGAPRPGWHAQVESSAEDDRLRALPVAGAQPRVPEVLRQFGTLRCERLG